MSFLICCIYNNIVSTSCQLLFKKIYDKFSRTNILLYLNSSKTCVPNICSGYPVRKKPNICSSHGKMKKYRKKTSVRLRGYLKPELAFLFFVLGIADSSRHELQNFTLPIYIFGKQRKSVKMPIFTLLIPYRTPYRQNLDFLVIFNNNNPKFQIYFMQNYIKNFNLTYKNQSFFDDDFLFQF